MIIAAIVWAAMAVLTYFVATSLMTTVFSPALVAFWSAIAWPIYLPMVIILAIRNP